MTKLTKEDKDNIILGGYLKYKDRKICPECVEVYFDKEDLDWIESIWQENKVKCGIEICEMHKLKKEQAESVNEKHICDNDIPSEEKK